MTGKLAWAVTNSILRVEVIVISIAILEKICKYFNFVNKEKDCNCYKNDSLEDINSTIPKTKIKILELTNINKLKKLYNTYPQFVKHRAKVVGYTEKDYKHANLKLVQDLCVVDFITNNINPRSKILEIGGGFSRVLSFFQNEYECWCLDKFEGVGNGPTRVPINQNYKIIQNYIGAFDPDLPSNSFDLVFSISVVEHINLSEHECLSIVQDIGRILKPDGYNVHCIDCRFPPKEKPDIGNRKLAKYMLKYYGFDESYIYNNYKNKDVFTMSKKAYDRFWKKACGNRPHTLDGLPFNIFLVTQK